MSEVFGQLALALSKTQGAMNGAVKDAANPFFKSKYADLASCWDACRDALSQNELAVVQLASAEGAAVTITTILMHSSGESLQSALTLTAKEDGPQAIGSAITYGRRYGLCAMVGIAPEDDDGNAASRPEAPTFTKATPPKPKGYDDNVITLEGVPVPEARKLFADWPQAHREYFTQVDKARYAAFKAKGAAYDKTAGLAATA